MSRIAFIGLGIMGSPMAVHLAAAGHEVAGYNPSPDKARPLVAQWVPGRWASLGTDGFGCSDTRFALRRHFKVDAESVVVTVLQQLAALGTIDPGTVATAIRRYRLDDPDFYPVGVSAGGES